MTQTGGNPINVVELDKTPGFTVQRVHSGVGSDPDSSLAIFKQAAYCIIAESCRIIGVMPVMGEFARAAFQTV